MVKNGVSIVVTLYKLLPELSILFGLQIRLCLDSRNI